MQDVASEFSQIFHWWFPRTLTAGGRAPPAPNTQPGPWPGATVLRPKPWSPSTLQPWLRPCAHWLVISPDGQWCTVGVVDVRTPPKIQALRVLVYFVTCNWSSSSVNSFNTAACQHSSDAYFSPQNAPKPFGAARPREGGGYLLPVNVVKCFLCCKYCLKSQ